MKNDTDREQGFIDDVQKTLQKKVTTLDPEIIVKLSAMRSGVVERSSYRFSGFWRMIRVTASAFMTLVILYLFTLVFYQAPASLYSSLASIEDMEILVSEESLDFYAELDFYTWLAEQQDVLLQEDESK